MESIIFLKGKLHTIFERLSYLQIRYEYRERLDTHIIHVLPTYSFEKDTLYAEMQFELEDDFNNLFFEENILFITDNELIEIECPLLELGVCSAEIDFKIVEPMILESYAFENKALFVLSEGFDSFYSPPPERKEFQKIIDKFKNKLTKKDLDKQHQGLFFI